MFAIDMLYSHCFYCLCLLLTCFIHIAIIRCMFEDNMHLLYHIYMVLIRLNQHILVYFVFYYPHLRTSLHCAIYYFSVKEWHKIHFSHLQANIKSACSFVDYFICSIVDYFTCTKTHTYIYM